MAGFAVRWVALEPVNPSDRPNGMPAAQNQRSDGTVLQSALIDRYRVVEKF